MAASIFEPIWRVLRRYRWLLAGFALLLASYSAAGFLLVPYLARSAIENYVQHDLGRHVAIAKLSFNPFTLTAEVTGFALTEADGTRIASFDLLRVDAQISSLLNRAWTFKEVRLDHPDLRVLVNAIRRSTSRLLPPTPATPSSGVPAIRIATLSVHDGRIGFDDRSRAKPFATTLMPIEFTLTDFRTGTEFSECLQL